MVSFFGDYDTTEAVCIPFNTFSSDDPSASVTITDLVAADIKIHKDGSTTQRASDSGITVSIDFDTITGNHLVAIDLSDNTDVGFYSAGSRYQVRMEGTTIDGATINAWIGAFSIGCTLRPATNGRTIVVDASGRVDVSLIEGSDATDQIRDSVVDDATKIDASALNTLSSHDPGATIAKAGDAMTLVDDAITAAKFDETTAYPLASADTGATTIARTGADGDTLETLSDQIDLQATSTALAIVDGIVDDILVDTGTVIPGQISGLNNLSAAEVNAEVDTALSDYDGPTYAEMEARTILSTDYFDPSVDVVAHVTLVDTTTTNTDMRGTDGAITSLSGVATETKQDTIISNQTTAEGKIDIIDSNVDSVLVDTNTTIPDLISALNDFDPTTESVNIGQILGSALSETSAGYIANALSYFFNVSPATKTVNDVGVSGSGLTAADVWTYGTRTLTAGTKDTEIDAILVCTDTTIPAQINGLNDISVADIFNETVTGAKYNIATSFGKRFLQLASSVIITGTSPGGNTANTIVLNGDASTVNGAYDPSLISISAGTGVGQSRLILEYVGASKTAVVDRNWKVIPDATSEYVITANPGRNSVNEGLAQDGGASTITLNNLASAVDDEYVGQLVFIRSGTGEDQVGLITAYNGTTKVAAVQTSWGVIPDSTSGYMIIPNSIPTSVSLSALVNAACDAALTDYDAATGTELASVDAKIDIIDGVVDNILIDTDTTIPAQISDLNDISPAEVNAEVDTALSDYDGPTNTEMEARTLLSANYGTAINQTAIEGKIDIIDANIDSVLEDTGTIIPSQINGLNNLSLSDVATTVNTQVLDVMNVDTYAEPGQGAPPATTSIFAKINYLFKGWRNQKVYSDSLGEESLYNDGATVVDQKRTCSDDGHVALKGEMESGA